jgi:hypothetical protein
MSEQDPELEAFSKFIAAVDPWLGEVVLVGGWAHRLYRLDPRARKLDYLPLTTLDGDVAVPPKLKKEESTVRKRLLEAGFEEEFIGEDRPPATHYHYGKGGGFYAEFLAPLEGSEYDRNGKRKATKEVGGVSSQLLSNSIEQKITEDQYERLRVNSRFLRSIEPATRLHWLENQTNRQNLVCPNRDFESVGILRLNWFLIPFDCVGGDEFAYR